MRVEDWMPFTHDYAEREPSRAEIDALAGPVVVEFGAPWCPHCHAVQPMLAELLRDHPEVRHIKIYDGKGQPLGRSFRVKLWPTLVFMRDGNVLATAVRPEEAEIANGLRTLIF
jgi:thioredoxin 1